MMRTPFNRRWGILACWLCLWLPLGTFAANTLDWNKDKDRLSADVRQLPLPVLLEKIATLTGWHVFVEPGMSQAASVKFKDRPSGEGLRLLLGDLNFALIPQTNNPARLYVFRTGMSQATKEIMARHRRDAETHRIPNELIVQLKPGQDIDALARQLGAKVTGRIPDLNIYRLQFDDAAAADAARDVLAADRNVAAVDSNYAIDQPTPSQVAAGISAATPQLRLEPPPNTGQVIVGVVDTYVQPLGNGLDALILAKLSVNGNSPANSDEPMHGTTMLSDIMASLSSVTQGSTTVRFVTADVFDKNGQADTFSVAQGFALVVKNGATIVNFSLGGAGDNSVLENIIRQAADKGIGMVAAAGNEPTGQPIYPAGYTGVMAVTALQNGQVAPYANVWPGVQVAAPGQSVMNFNGRAWYSVGTSVSTALVTGFAAGVASTTGQTWSQVQGVLNSRLPVPSKK